LPVILCLVRYNKGRRGGPTEGDFMDIAGIEQKRDGVQETMRQIRCMRRGRRVSGG